MVFLHAIEHLNSVYVAQTQSFAWLKATVQDNIQPSDVQTSLLKINLDIHDRTDELD